MIGFVDVERLEGRGFRYAQDSTEERKLGAELGLELVQLAYPVVTRVPWPMYTRHRVRIGKPTPGTKPFLVRPLTEAEVHRLTTRDHLGVDKVRIGMGLLGEGEVIDSRALVVAPDVALEGVLRRTLEAPALSAEQATVDDLLERQTQTRRGVDPASLIRADQEQEILSRTCVF